MTILADEISPYDSPESQFMDQAQTVRALEKVKNSRYSEALRMKILAIESSCDETAVALWDCEHGLINEKISSQIEIHRRFGGVVPEVASREHLRILPWLVKSLTHEAGVNWDSIGSIAVTAGPGLLGALLVGVSYGRAVATAHRIPVLPIHHMEGHLLAPGIDAELPTFPFITLLVSGGHTMLVRVDAVGQYTLIGQTLDDAAGECFDKSARLLGLQYPGGPLLSKLAEGGNPAAFSLPRPMLNRQNLNFSFSGLKTAVMYAIRNAQGIEDDVQMKADMAASIEAAIADIIVGKSLRACQFEGISNLVIAGGVAANCRIRTQLKKSCEQHAIQLYLPKLEYCTDNAAMIAHAAALRLKSNLTFPETWDVRARWPLNELAT
ncbi:MAG: tRNA (adenosine(37)-N6)-threonylcarbamoyltransferase complex transferase subunit TsaD [Mariprofundaceae bacterium]